MGTLILEKQSQNCLLQQIVIKFHNNPILCLHRLPHFQVLLVEMNQGRATLVSAENVLIYGVTALLTLVNNQEPWGKKMFSLDL